MDSRKIYIDFPITSYIKINGEISFPDEAFSLKNLNPFIYHRYSMLRSIDNDTVIPMSKKYYKLYNTIQMPISTSEDFHRGRNPPYPIKFQYSSNSKILYEIEDTHHEYKICNQFGLKDMFYGLMKGNEFIPLIRFTGDIYHTDVKFYNEKEYNKLNFSVMNTTASEKDEPNYKTFKVKLIRGDTVYYEKFIIFKELEDHETSGAVFPSDYESDDNDDN